MYDMICSGGLTCLNCYHGRRYYQAGKSIDIHSTGRPSGRLCKNANGVISHADTDGAGDGSLG